MTLPGGTQDGAFTRQVMLSYTKSVALAMERRLMDERPETSAVYWEWFMEEINIGRHRMEMITAQIREGCALKGRRMERSPVLVGEGNEVHALAPKKLSQEK